MIFSAISASQRLKTPENESTHFPSFHCIKLFYFFGISIMFQNLLFFLFFLFFLFSYTHHQSVSHQSFDFCHKNQYLSWHLLTTGTFCHKRYLLFICYFWHQKNQTKQYNSISRRPFVTRGTSSSLHSLSLLNAIT